MKHIFGQRTVKGKDNKFSEDAEIYGEPKISKSLIYGGNISGLKMGYNSPRIFNSSISFLPFLTGQYQISGSHISGLAKISDKAMVIDSVVSELAQIRDNAVVNECWVDGEAKILGESFAYRCNISGNAQIEGTAYVKNCDLWGHHYLHEGNWTRPPITYTASGFTISECVDNKLVINCICNTYEKWLGGAGRRYGKILGLTEEQIDEIELLIRRVRWESELIRGVRGM